MENDSMPLKGIRVIDFSNFVAGPVVGKILADWGANVIKVERFEGDPWRWYGVNYQTPCEPDENPLFDMENLNKKFAALNLKTDEGMAIMQRLVAGADIFVTNFRTDALRKLKLAYEDLKETCPRLIYGHVQGFGDNGPEGSRPGFDVVAFWARSGAMIDLVPAEKNVPLTAPFGFGDHVTGGILVGGLCAALYKREKSGQGDRVYISLLGNGIFSVGSMVMSAQPKYGNPFPRSRLQPTNAAGTQYQCQDGRWIMLSILEYERYWPVLCEKVLGHPDLAHDKRFDTKEKAKENKAIAVPLLAEIFATKTADEWCRLLLAADIAFEKVAKFIDVTSDVQAWANGYLFEHTFPNGNKAILPKTPVRFDSFEHGAPLPGAGTRVGEHTKEVLLDMGYSPDEVQSLKEKNIILCA